jgi:hypothetical protein
LSSRIFTVGPISAQTASHLLKNYRKETPTKIEGGKSIGLVTSIHEVHADGNEIRGEIEYDFLVPISYHGQVQQIPQTNTRRFCLEVKSTAIGSLVVFETGQQIVAEKLNRILFGNDEAIHAGKIPTDRLRAFIEANAQVEFWVWWKNLKIPFLTKAALRGTDLAQASDYQRYDKLGQKYYAIIKLKKRGWTISISEDAAVLLFSTSAADEEVFLGFLRNEIEPLIK